MYLPNHFFLIILGHSGLIQKLEGVGGQAEPEIILNFPSWASSNAGGQAALKSSLPARQVLLRFLCQPLCYYMKFVFFRLKTRGPLVL